MTESHYTTPLEQPEARLVSNYLRNSTFESGTKAPSLGEGVKPEMKLELRVQVNPSSDNYEVVLDMGITAREQSNLLYLVKLQQAGCFALKNFDEKQREIFLNTICPNVLYPFASHIANTMVINAGFPALNLTPVDFSHLYQQHQIVQAKAPAQDTQASAVN